MPSPKKFLIINYFGIGDVLFTTPMISALRAHHPDCFIGFICNARALPILETNPKINRLYVYDRDAYLEVWKKAKCEWMKLVGHVVREIRDEHYDVVLDLSLDRFMGLVGLVVGIPERIGFDYKRRGCFLNQRVNIEGFYDRHVVEHYIDLLKFIDIPVRTKKMEVFVSEADRIWAREQLAANGVKSEDRVVGLVPGGGLTWGKDVVYRRWPPDQHAALADKIVEKFRVKVILLGDSAEQDLGREVTARMKNPAISFVGQTTVGQYLAFLGLCHLVILNDGGPLHMAVAAGAKTVSLIGPVDENVYGPYPVAGQKVVTKDIACRPCYRHFRRAACQHINCLRTITVDEVFAKVQGAFEDSPSPVEIAVS